MFLSFPVPFRHGARGEHPLLSPVFLVTGGGAGQTGLTVALMLRHWCGDGGGGAQLECRQS